jgi:signal transduction histidine kinase
MRLWNAVRAWLASANLGDDDPAHDRVGFLGWSLPMPHPAYRLDRADLRPATWPNVALAVVACALFLTGALFTEEGEVSISEVSPQGVLAYAIGLVPLALIAWRPRIGELLLGTALVCWVAAGFLGLDSGPDFAAFVAIYTIGTRRSWRQTAVAVGLTAVAGALVGVAVGRERTLLDILGTALAVAVAMSLAAALGLFIGRRRSYVRSLLERAVHLERERDALEQERELLAREAVAIERARIARELHDVVAHHVSVMVIQAGAAQASLGPESGAAGQAIEAVRETGREALAEMRRMLGLLRSEVTLEPAGEASDGAETEQGRDPARAPQPGLKDLGLLTARTRDAGVGVAVETIGAVRRLPAGVDLSAYRIVQEALTNTLRHAGPGSRALVRITYGPDSLVLEILDDGLGHPAVERSRHGVGHGLVGMRERVALFGGWLEAGPRAEGGFRVMASFSLEAEPGAAPAVDPPKRQPRGDLR